MYELLATIDTLKAALAARDATLAERDAHIAVLAKRLAEVERILNRDSSNVVPRPVRLDCG